MFRLQSMGFLLFLTLVCLSPVTFSGCGGSTAREVSESADRTFDDMAAQAAAETEANEAAGEKDAEE